MARGVCVRVYVRERTLNTYTWRSGGFVRRRCAEARSWAGLQRPGRGEETTVGGAVRGVGGAVKDGRHRVLVRVLTFAGRWWADSEAPGSDRAAHS